MGRLSAAQSLRGLSLFFKTAEVLWQWDRARGQKMIIIWLRLQADLIWILVWSLLWKEWLVAWLLVGWAVKGKRGAIISCVNLVCIAYGTIAFSSSWRFTSVQSAMVCVSSAQLWSNHICSECDGGCICQQVPAAAFLNLLLSFHPLLCSSSSLLISSGSSFWFYWSFFLFFVFCFFLWDREL